MAWYRKRPVRFLIGFLVTLLALQALRVLVPVEKVRDLALEQAQARLGREIAVGEVGLSIRGGLGVRLSDFVLHNPDGFDGAPLVSAKALDLKVEILPLRKGEIRIHRLVLEQPEVNLVRRADGTDNFTFAPADTAPAPAEAGAPTEPADAPPPISITSLTLRDGALTFADATADAGLSRMALTGLTVGLSLTDPAPGVFQATGRAQAAEVVLTTPAEVPVLEVDVDFDLTWNATDERLDITRADTGVNDLPLAVTGAVTLANETYTGAVDLAAKDISLTDLMPFLPRDLAEKIHGDADSGRLDMAVNLDLDGAREVPVVTTGTVTVRNADLAVAQPFLPPEQTGRVAGRADLDLTFADRTGDPELVTYEGTVTVRDMSYTDSGLVDELQHLDGTMSFTPDVFTVTQCRARFASGTFDLTGELKDPFPYFLPPEQQLGKARKIPHLDFTLHAAHLDVDRLLPAASPTASAPGGPPRPSPISTLPPAPEFPALSAAGSFTADSLLYMAVPFTAVKGRVTLADRQLSVHDVTGDVYRGTVAGQVDMDLTDLRDPVYTGQYAAQNIEVDDFVTRFAGLAGVLFGGCNLGGTFAAHGLTPDAIRNSLTLDADADIREGKVVTTGSTYNALNKLAATAGQTLNQEQALKDLATHIKVADGRVGLDSLTTRLGQFGDLTFSGSYGFAGDLDYGGRLLLTKAQTDAIFTGGGLLGELGRLMGSERPERLEFPLSVGGMRGDPKVKLDLGTVTADLQQRVAREQGRKLEDEAKSKLNDLLKKWK